MKKLAILTASILTIGIGTAYAQHKGYTEDQIKEMPRFASIEQQRCPKARYPSVKNRLECKHEVRVEIYEKRIERAKNEHEG
jgi:hypothetical protein